MYTIVHNAYKQDFMPEHKRLKQPILKLVDLLKLKQTLHATSKFRMHHKMEGTTLPSKHNETTRLTTIHKRRLPIPLISSTVIFKSLKVITA